jgi:c-di-GMP-related signal transduction protein
MIEYFGYQMLFRDSDENSSEVMIHEPNEQQVMLLTTVRSLP